MRRWRASSRRKAPIRARPVRSAAAAPRSRSARREEASRSGSPRANNQVCSLQFAVRSLRSAVYSLRFTVYSSAVLSTAPLLETSFPDLKLHGRGKVRDIYQVGDAACCSSRPIASPRSTTCWARASPTRARCSRSCRPSGSSGWAISCRITSSPPTSTQYPAALQPYAATLRGRSMLVPPHRARCRSSASRAATCRAPAGRNTSRPAASAA